MAELQGNIKESEKRHATTGYPITTLLVAESIANGNNELNKKAAPVQMKAT